MIGIVLAQLFAKAIDLGPSDPQDWGFGLVETSWGYLLYGRSARGLTIVKASADGTPLSAYRGLLPNQLIWLWITDFKKHQTEDSLRADIPTALAQERSRLSC